MALIDSGSEVNAMTPAYAAKLDLTTQKTSVDAQKINSSSLETYDMASAKLLLQNSLRKVWFCEQIFLLTNINMEVVPRIPFLSISHTDVMFAKLEKLT